MMAREDDVGVEEVVVGVGGVVDLLYGMVSVRRFNTPFSSFTIKWG